MVYIEFNKEMQTPKALNHFHQNRVLILSVLSNFLTEEQRKRAVKSWKIESFKERQMEMQIVWEEPWLISALGDLDLLLVTVVNEAYFASKEGELIFPGSSAVGEAKPQISQKEEEEVRHIASIISQLLQVTAFISVFMNIFFASALQLVWKMLGAVQLIVHLPLLNLHFPRNARLCF